MTKQQRVIEMINNRAQEINATVEIEYERGNAIVEVRWYGSSSSAQLFVILGKRGGVRCVQYTDLLGRFLLLQKGDKYKAYHMWDFFRIVGRQQKLSLGLEAKLAVA